MELTTSWKEEGRQEGRREGQLELVLRLLHRRLRSLSTENEAQVRTLSPEQLTSLGEALFDFQTEADLKRWLGK